MFHIILNFSVALLFLISGIVNKAFEGVLCAVIFLVLGVISVMKYDKNTRSVPIFTSRGFLLGCRIFLGVAYGIAAIARDEPRNFIWSAIWFGSAIIYVFKEYIKSPKEEKTLPIVQTMPVAVPNAAVQVIPDAFPDKPQPIGYKSTWMCIKDTTPEQVIEKMELKNPVLANWQSGLSQYGSRIFVSPVVKGYVMVVGYEIFQGAGSEQELLRLYEIAKGFREVQCFATHRVAEFHIWAKFSLGRLIRCYGWCDGV